MFTYRVMLKMTYPFSILEGVQSQDDTNGVHSFIYVGGVKHTEILLRVMVRRALFYLL